MWSSLGGAQSWGDGEGEHRVSDTREVSFQASLGQEHWRGQGAVAGTVGCWGWSKGCTQRRAGGQDQGSVPSVGSREGPVGPPAATG